VLRQKDPHPDTSHNENGEGKNKKKIWKQQKKISTTD
jgi:hypothetical protein